MLDVRLPLSDPCQGLSLSGEPLVLVGGTACACRGDRLCLSTVNRSDFSTRSCTVHYCYYSLSLCTSAVLYYDLRKL
jgi:hypothetical protein